MGFWTDCINPFNKPIHGFYSNNQIYSYQKMCPVCWNLALHLEKYKSPITLNQNSKPTSFKQCGTDTL